MPGSPPRRTRRSQPPSGGSSLPILPILIGVIVLGFVIGAGLSLAGKRAGDGVPIASASTPPATIPPLPSPLAASATTAATASPATPSPRPTRSPKPLPSPSPIPTPSASPSASAAPSLTPSPEASASPGHSPSAAPTARPTARSTPSPAAPPSAAPAPKVVAHGPPPPPPPTPVPPTSAPVANVATATPEVASPSAAPAAPASSFARLAASVVRVYLASLARGDKVSAAAELALPASGAGPEDGIVDATTEIDRVDVRGTGDVVTVDVDLRTSTGRYAAQYTVKKSATGAALIADRAIVKH